MTKAELKNLMKKYGIVESELDDVFDFVSQLLHRRAKEVERKEPYATHTIDRLTHSSYEAWDLINYVSELEEEQLNTSVKEH